MPILSFIGYTLIKFLENLEIGDSFFYILNIYTVT